MRRATDRGSAIAAGVTIVLVPTVFALFPEWAKSAAIIRVGVLLIWIAAATVVVIAGVQQSEHIEELLTPGRRRRDNARHVAGQRILRALLVPEAAGFPAHCEFRVFLPNRGGDRLLPEYESPGSSPSEGWEPGKGAVGAAFASASLVRVHGAAVWDGTYGLTPAQQEKNRGLAAVVAMPLLNARVLAVGVLAVSTTVEDPFIVSDPAAEMIRELAEVVARVLIDVFRVSRD